MTHLLYELRSKIQERRIDAQKKMMTEKHCSHHVVEPFEAGYECAMQEAWELLDSQIKDIESRLAQYKREFSKEPSTGRYYNAKITELELVLGKKSLEYTLAMSSHATITYDTYTCPKCMIQFRTLEEIVSHAEICQKEGEKE